MYRVTTQQCFTTVAPLHYVRGLRSRDQRKAFRLISFGLHRLPLPGSCRCLHGAACAAEGPPGGHPQRPEPRAPVHLHGARPRPARVAPAVHPRSEEIAVAEITAP